MTKRVVLSVAAFWLGAAVFTVGTGIDAKRAAAQDPGYHWVNVTNSAAYAPRDGAGALVYDDKMWLLGGWNPPDTVNFPRGCNNEVWNSTNGADWTLVKPNTFNSGYDPATDWEGRHTAGYAVYDDKMWIVGGDPLQGHYQTDVWNSTDGVNWTQVNVGNPAPWGERVLHHTLTFQNKIWVMGGQTLPPYVSSPPEAFYNDVWNTTDGINWTPVPTEGPMWEPRGMIGNNVVFNNRMWILGGGTYNTPTTPDRKYYNDVWSSADGVSWTKHLDSAPWDPREYHDVAVFDNKMWVMEGYNGTLGGNRKDVWYSENGVDWTEVPNTPWAPRHAASVYTYDDALWMVAGNNMQKDVWKLVRNQANPPSTNPSRALVVTDTSEVRLYNRDLTSMTASMSPGGVVTGAKYLKNGNVVVSNDAGQLRLYSGADLSPISSAMSFAEGVSNIVPLANGNFAVAAHSTDPGTNYGVWIYDGTTGGLINSNVNWKAPVKHLIETKTGNIAFAVDQAGDGGGSIIMLNGSSGTVMGNEPGWGDIQTFSAMDGGRGDVLFTATRDDRYGAVYANTWGTINGATGDYAYSNPNWAYVPTVAGTANGEVVWNGVEAGKSYLFRFTADGGIVQGGYHFATEPVEQIVELANGNIGLSLMYAKPGDPLKGEAWISNSNFTAWYNSNTGWEDTPVLAAVPNSDGDMFMYAVDGSLKWAGLFDGANMNNIIAARSGVGAEMGEIIVLPNGNLFFSTTGQVALVTSGTEENQLLPPRFLPDVGGLATPLIAGGLEDNYIYHAGGAMVDIDYDGELEQCWFVWAGSGTGAADAPYDIGGFLTAGGGAPLFLDYFYNPDALLLLGDANDDGFVDDKDASILGAHWMQSGDGIGWGDGDFNEDHVVNDKDAAILAAHWNPAGESAATPEPSSSVMLLGLLLGTLAFYRRRMNPGQTRAPLGARR
ncbi:MAG: hypothetical protein NTW96_04930 [Planctomycetia bacterium]|nr:hypothetical protein [Planctomycetia bacterium]